MSFDGGGILSCEAAVATGHSLAPDTPRFEVELGYFRWHDSPTIRNSEMPGAAFARVVIVVEGEARSEHVVEGDEACDDGNELDNDACLNNCQAARCGDGIVGPGEGCDDGNTLIVDFLGV